MIEDLEGLVAQLLEAARQRSIGARADADFMEERAGRLREQVIADQGYIAALLEVQRAMLPAPDGPLGDSAALKDETA